MASELDALIVSASKLLHSVRELASSASGGVEGRRADFDAKLAELTRVIAQIEEEGGADTAGKGAAEEEDDGSPASAEDLATLQGLRTEIAAKNVLLKGLIDRLRDIQASVDDSLEADQ